MFFRLVSPGNLADCMVDGCALAKTMPMSLLKYLLDAWKEARMGETVQQEELLGTYVSRKALKTK